MPREALNLDSGPGLSPMDTVILQPLPSRGCTTTLSETYGYPCTWDGTETIYPSTTIMFRQVDCNGCNVLDVRKSIYFCPNQIITATAKVGVPSIFWSTTCQPSALNHRDEQRTPATTTIPGSGAAKTVDAVATITTFPGS